MPDREYEVGEVTQMVCRKHGELYKVELCEGTVGEYAGKYWRQRSK